LDFSFLIKTLLFTARTQGINSYIETLIDGRMTRVEKTNRIRSSFVGRRPAKQLKGAAYPRAGRKMGFWKPDKRT